MPCMSFMPPSEHPTTTTQTPQKKQDWPPPPVLCTLLSFRPARKNALQLRAGPRSPAPGLRRVRPPPSSWPFHAPSGTGRAPRRQGGVGTSVQARNAATRALPLGTAGTHRNHGKTKERHFKTRWISAWQGWRRTAVIWTPSTLVHPAGFV